MDKKHKDSLLEAANALSLLASSQLSNQPGSSVGNAAGGHNSPMHAEQGAACHSVQSEDAALIDLLELQYLARELGGSEQGAPVLDFLAQQTSAILQKMEDD